MKREKGKRKGEKREDSRKSSWGGFFLVKF